MCRGEIFGQMLNLVSTINHESSHEVKRHLDGFQFSRIVRLQQIQGLELTPPFPDEWEFCILGHRACFSRFF